MPAKKNIPALPPDSAFNNTQLSLFQTFLCNGPDERDRLSNTIELWDGVPKYCMSRQDMNKQRDKGMLPTLERRFEHRGRAYIVKIRPARLTDAKGRDKEFYPSAREELMEDALRKIAVEQQHGFLEQQESGVVFTLHLLRQELGRRGHTLSYQEVVESLNVLVGCRIEIHTADGSSGYQTPILTDLLRVSRSRYLADPQARWLAHFSPLVTRSILTLSYRQYNYHTMMSHTTQLARWLHKRLAHNYVNASLIHPYTILFSTLQRGSGLLEYKEQRQAVRKLDETLEELKTHSVLLNAQKDVCRGLRGRILDVTYQLRPHPQFVAQVKAANKRQHDHLDQLPPSPPPLPGE